MFMERRDFMGYVDWYEYMKNPYEKQSNIICHKNNDSFTWSDLITGNNFILSKKTKNNIINSFQLCC